MRLIKFETVYQMTFMPRVFPVNCYLVEETNDLTLIDAGMEFCGKDILKTASGIGKPVTRIVLTHPHADHIGALDYLKANLPEASVFISERDSLLMNGDLSLKPGEENTPIRGGFKKDLKTHADVLIAEGDSIGSLQAVAVPGHTPGSMAFYDPRSKMLIAGDAFQTRGGLAVTGDTRILFPFPSAATWSKRQAVASARKLNRMDFRFLAVGHGDVLGNPASLIEAAIRRAEAKLTRQV